MNRIYSSTYDPIAKTAMLTDKWQYSYLEKDHLGNTRVQLLTAQRSIQGMKNYTVAQTTDYYPFGMEQENPTKTPLTAIRGNVANDYLYNGKEMDRMHGLNMLDYGARWYDNAVPHFPTGDPKAEKYYDTSLYVYCSDNPIKFVDPDGRGPWDVVKGTGTVIGGGGMFVAGVALCAAPTGVSQVVGGVLIAAGSSTVALGTAQIVDGAVNDGKHNVPGGPAEMSGVIIDKINGNQNNVARNTGAVIDFGAGFLVPLKNVTPIVEKVVNASTVVNGFALVQQVAQTGDAKTQNTQAQPSNNEKAPQQKNQESTTTQKSDNTMVAKPIIKLPEPPKEQ